jgi:putative oxidoreductase
MKHFGLLILRMTVGTLLAGHGAQKLMGWFGGPGLKGTHGFMESLGMKPARVWGTMAAGSEFSGGIMTALGLLNPVGPLNIIGAMLVATRKVHWGKPVWAGEGGAELPLTNIAAASAIALAGPGKYSLDHALGIRVPRWIAAFAWLSTVGVTVAAIRRPEIAQTMIDKASSVMPGASSRPTADPELVVETRSTVEETQEVKTAGGI